MTIEPHLGMFVPIRHLRKSVTNLVGLEKIKHEGKKFRSCYGLKFPVPLGAERPPRVIRTAFLELNAISTRFPEDNLFRTWVPIRWPLSVTDNEQGQLNDGWLIASLVALVHTQPELVQTFVKEIRDEETDMVKHYQATLFKDGKKMMINVGNLFPCDRDTNLLLYGATKRRQLLLPIIEKATACMFHNYEALDTGHPQDGFSILSGCPNWTFPVGASVDGGLLWKKLFDTRRQNLSCTVPMVAKSGSISQANDYSTVGLKPQSCYTLLDVATVDNENGSANILQLFSPRRGDAWLGEWNDRCANWRNVPQRTKAQHNPTMSRNGIFWIPLDQFQRFFTDVTYCLARWQCEFRFEAILPRSGDANEEFSVFQVTVPEPGTKLAISIYQNSNKDDVNRRFPLMPIGVAVYNMYWSDCRPKEANHLKAFSGYALDGHKCCAFEASTGKFVVVPLSFSQSWTVPQSKSPHTNRKNKFVIALHASKSVKVNPLWSAVKFLGDSLFELTTVAGHTSKQQLDKSGLVWLYSREEDWEGRVIAVVNKSKKHAKVTIDASESSNVIATRGLCDAGNPNSILTVDVIPPGTWMLVNVLSRCSPTESYNVEYSVDYSATLGPVSHNPALGHNKTIHSPREFI